MKNSLTEAALPGGPRLSIAVVMGGPGNEREVSLRTGESVRAALSGAGHDVRGVVVDGPGWELPFRADLVFLALHGTYGEDGTIQAELERLGLAYTGAGVEASRVAFDKVLAKERFLAAGVPTPAHRVYRRGERVDFPFPLVAKPPREGSSVGVHRVRVAEELPAALEDVYRHGETALVERWIEGRELTVGILDDEALPVVEIRPRGGFYDLANKYPWLGGGAGSDYECPASLDAATTAAVQAAAVAAHRAVGCEVYSRVDVLLDGESQPWVLEVNTIPGMTETSLLPKAAAAAGLDFSTLCLEIARVSLRIRPRLLE